MWMFPESPFLQTARLLSPKYHHIHWITISIFGLPTFTVVNGFEEKNVFVSVEVMWIQLLDSIHIDVQAYSNLTFVLYRCI
jgi:hypothetical protein